MRPHPQEYHSQVGPTSLTVREALDLLAKSDHGLLAEGPARAICRAFGVPEFVEAYPVTPSQHKGLTAWDDAGNELPEGSVIYGAAAHELALHICHALNVSYLPMLGRGSQLRTCITALATWLDFGQPKL